MRWPSSALTTRATRPPPRSRPSTDNVESALSGGDYSAALTDFENEGTTVLYAFLNGYPDSVGSGLISPEFGLLTNTTDGAATGQIDALAQISNTIADEVANLGGANLTTGSLPLVTGNLDLSVSLDQILTDLGLTSGGSAAHHQWTPRRPGYLPHVRYPADPHHR